MTTEATGSQNILVVDDDQAMTSLLRQHLKPHGYEVAACDCARKAVEEARRLHPRFVLLDVMLGDGLGYQVARKFRMDHELYRIPILFISCLGEEEDKTLALREGGDAYLTKPFNLEQILEKIHGLERTLKSIEERDALTGLPGVEALHREVDRKLSLHKPVGLMIVGLAHFREWCLAKSDRNTETGAPRMTAFLKQALADLEVYETTMSHLGQAIFLLALNEEDLDKVKHRLPKLFEAARRNFHTVDELEQGHVVCSKQVGTFEGHPLVELLAVGIRSSDFSFQSCYDMQMLCRRRYERAEHKTGGKVFAINQNKRPR
jgi:CheY-like chemotaxis protein